MLSGINITPFFEFYPNKGLTGIIIFIQQAQHINSINIFYIQYSQITLLVPAQQNWLIAGSKKKYFTIIFHNFELILYRK